jgi:hypothetical protein
MTTKWPAPIVVADPRPGDFLCVPISGGVGLAVEVGQFLDGQKFQPYEHAEVYVGQPDEGGPHGYTVSAYPGGKGRRPLPCPPAKVPGSLWSSGLVRLADSQRQDIVAWCLDHQEVGYSSLDYFALAAHRLSLPVPQLREYIASTEHMICSQYVDTAYAAGRVHLFKDLRWPGFVDPMDLAGLLESRLAAQV